MHTDPQPGPATTQDSHARPKVLRRPQQFSRRAAPVTESAPAPVTLAPAPAAGITPRGTPRREAAPGWQEDSRFGMALIVVVALVNLVLALVLPLIKHPIVEVNSPAMTPLTNTAAMPAPIASDGPSGVTVYAEPADSQDPDESMDLKSLPEDSNHFVTNPEEVPPPTARSMQDESQ